MKKNWRRAIKCPVCDATNFPTKKDLDKHYARTHEKTHQTSLIECGTNEARR